MNNDKKDNKDIDTNEEWETRSLGLLHKIREEIMKEAEQSSKDISSWLRNRKAPDIRELCRKLGLTNVTERKHVNKTKHGEKSV